MRKPQFLPIGPAEKRWLAEFVHRLLPVAADARHAMSRVAKSQVSLAMWRWTADGINRDGHVVPDSIKYDPRHLPATRDALVLIERGERKSVRHEHVVPRSLLTGYLLECQPDIAGVEAILQKFCHGVLVTVQEDARLRTKTMPPGWTWDAGDVWERYVEAGLLGAIVPPALAPENNQ